MELRIKLEKTTGILEIWEDREETSRLVDKLGFDYERDLSSRLIDSLDKLLKKNTLDLASIFSYTLELGALISQDSTACKIGEAFIEGLKTSPVLLLHSIHN